MTYSIELDGEDVAFIKACVLGVVRRAQSSSMDIADQTNLTLQAAKCLTRLNEARMTHIDVMFLNTCIEKTKGFLRTDDMLPLEQIQVATRLAGEIQNKLAGVGRARNVLTDV